jgi:hypothetical protein
MSHFARVIDGVVTDVIVADQDFINNGHAGDPAQWIETCNRTRSGIHLDGGVPLRKNYASIGDAYDVERDAFIPPPAFASWVLDEFKCIYQAPVAYPEDGKNYRWDEDNQVWIERPALT